MTDSTTNPIPFMDSSESDVSDPLIEQNGGTTQTEEQKVTEQPKDISEKSDNKLEPIERQSTDAVTPQRQRQTKDLSSVGLKPKKTRSLEEMLWWQHCPVWMPLADGHNKLDTKKTIDILKSLQMIRIYDNIDVFDNLFGDSNASKNCFTVRNESLQKIFYVGSVDNRSVGRCLAFTLRVVDQFSRHVLSIKKHFIGCCLGLYRVDVFSSDGTRVGKIVEKRSADSTNEFAIYDQSVQSSTFTIRRLSKSPVRYKFDIVCEDQVIGHIIKIFEKRPNLQCASITSDDKYVKVSLTSPLSSKDKALVLSAALVINVLFLRHIKRQ